MYVDTPAPWILWIVESNNLTTQVFVEKLAGLVGILELNISCRYLRDVKDAGVTLSQCKQVGRKWLFLAAGDNWTEVILVNPNILLIYNHLQRPSENAHDLTFRW